jgi:predicted MPP superfamily phosphohydrolase
MAARTAMPKKLFIASDLHLEFGTNFQPPASADQADIIVLPGDIWKKDNGIHWARSTWPDKPIVYVAGNHEFYGQQRGNVLAMLRIAANETGVHFLENDEVVIEGVRFLGCTLWTDFMLYGKSKKNQCMVHCTEFITDFRVIHEGAAHFSTVDSIRLFNESVAWLESKLDEDFDGQTVVATHHLPSRKSVAQKWDGDLGSAAFASNLDRLFGKSALWVHGHTHDSFDYVAEGTRVVCNPRGYHLYDKGFENPDFQPGLLIEI